MRESEGDRGVLVLSQWFSVTSLSLVLPSSASLLSVSSFETGQGIRVLPGREHEPKPSRSASLSLPVSKMLPCLPGTTSRSGQKTRQRQRKVLKVITVPITNSLTCISVMETNEALFKKLIVPFANGRASR